MVKFHTKKNKNRDLKFIDLKLVEEKNMKSEWKYNLKFQSIKKENERNGWKWKWKKIKIEK